MKDRMGRGIGHARKEGKMKSIQMERSKRINQRINEL